MIDPATGHLPLFIEKMKAENLPERVIRLFSHYYDEIVHEKTGKITGDEIRPLRPEEVDDHAALDRYAASGAQALEHAAVIKLNGGLGTSMGLTGPKSLLKVKDGLSFLQITLRQAERAGARLCLMNSFSTDSATKNALSADGRSGSALTFLQHKFPKVLVKDLSPARCPENPELEWNPPGHGEIYLTLYISGTLEKLLKNGVTHAFISNSDNLGAVLDPGILGWFVDSGRPFAMEVCRRTPADMKGGHLAAYRSGGGLCLRESAQCPDDEMDAFSDIDKYGYFNTNSIWVDLRALKTYFDGGNDLHLSMILNKKTLDPRNPDSPEVYQVESAMGAAVSAFEGAGLLDVPRSRFIPVKKCNELLVVRSDRYYLTEDSFMRRNPENDPDDVLVRLDPDFFGKVDDFDARFPEGPPSLVNCASLEVKGDVKFMGGVVMKGNVRVENRGKEPVTIENGRVLEGNLVF